MVTTNASDHYFFLTPIIPSHQKEICYIRILLFLADTAAVQVRICIGFWIRQYVTTNNVLFVVCEYIVLPATLATRITDVSACSSFEHLLLLLFWTFIIISAYCFDEFQWLFKYCSVFLIGHLILFEFFWCCENIGNILYRNYIDVVITHKPWHLLQCARIHYVGYLPN